jgi:hypothetical protein
MSLTSCANMSEEAKQRWLIAGAVLAAAGGAYAIGRNQGYANGYAAHQLTDYDWAWDQFYNANYALVWACRGKQTGQFADMAKCQYKPQNDLTWPGYSTR